MSTSQDIYTKLNARSAIKIAVPTLVWHLAYVYDTHNMSRDDCRKSLSIKVDSYKNSNVSKPYFDFKPHTEFASFTIYLPYEEYKLEQIRDHPKLHFDRSPTKLWNINYNNEEINIFKSKLNEFFEYREPDIDIRQIILDDDPEQEHDRIVHSLFRDSDINKIVGSIISNHAAYVWLDFGSKAKRHITTHYNRALVLNNSMNEARLGRLIHRLLDIETYLAMSLRSLPKAQEQLQYLDDKQKDLNNAIQKLSSPGQNLEESLKTITRISEENSSGISAIRYNIYTSIDYAEIAKARLGELNEQKLERWLRISTFVNRQLNPAVKIYESVIRGQDVIARFISEVVVILQTKANLYTNKKERTMNLTLGALSLLGTTYYTYHLIQGHTILSEWRDDTIKFFIFAIFSILLLIANFAYPAKCLFCNLMGNRLKKEDDRASAKPIEGRL